MSTFPLLQLKKVSLSIGNQPLFEDISLSLTRGSRACIVGRNGSGKTTLMKMMAGLLTPDEGEIFVQPGTKISFMPQDPLLPKNLTALEYLQEGGRASHYEAEKTLELLKISPEKKLDSLSGGEARRISLAHALVVTPDILLLDEPTNHLDLPAIEWLENYLAHYKGTMALISHDRAFLSNITSTTFWLDRRILRSFPKGYKFFDAWSEKIFEEEIKTQLKLDRLIEEETHWSHEGISARRRRNQGRLKRLYELREKKSHLIKSLKLARLNASSPETSSHNIIEARHLHHEYGGRTLIKDFSITITRGERIGIVGPNGAGKTTLLKILIGELKPLSGKIKVSKTLDFSYMDQNRHVLDPTKTLWETLCPNGGDFLSVQGQQKHVISYLKEFLFHPQQAKSPVSILSGGEKNRLLLALSLAKHSNMLILDEPTNDLDVDTLDRLQEMLCDYEGTILLVSHDRNFLDQVVTSLIVIGEEGDVIEYAGGYADFICQKPQKISEEKKKVFSKKSPKSQDLSSQTKKTSRLTFKHQHALKELPKKIDTLTQYIYSLEKELSHPSLYTDDPARFHQVVKELEESRKTRELYEDQWLEIEILKENEHYHR